MACFSASPASTQQPNICFCPNGNILLRDEFQRGASSTTSVWTYTPRVVSTSVYFPRCPLLTCPRTGTFMLRIHKICYVLVAVRVHMAGEVAVVSFLVLGVVPTRARSDKPWMRAAYYTTNVRNCVNASPAFYSIPVAEVEQLDDDTQTVCRDIGVDRSCRASNTYIHDELLPQSLLKCSVTNR